MYMYVMMYVCLYVYMYIHIHIDIKSSLSTHPTWRGLSYCSAGDYTLTKLDRKSVV